MEDTQKIIEILSPLRHEERDAALSLLIKMREHWFQRETVCCAIEEYVYEGAELPHK